MIKFGMSLPQIFNQLFKGYQKFTGRKPEGLDLIKLKQEAMQKFKEMKKVVDMKGQPIDPSKPILGGSQEGITGISQGQKLYLQKTGRLKPRELKTDDEIKAAIEKQNKESAKKLTEKMKDDYNPFEDFAQGGRAGLKDGVLKRGLKSVTGSDTYKTLEDRGFNAAVLMSEGFDQIFNLLSSVPFAEGGRIGYKDGPKKPGRRKFIKTAVGIASMLPFGIGKGVKMAAPVVTKAAEIAEPALAKLVESVMSAGKLVSVAGTKVKNMVTKKKLKNVEVEEDIADGSYIIKKEGKEIYYKPGRMDETGGIDDSIIEVIDKTIKKSSGGVARMLGE